MSSDDTTYDAVIVGAGIAGAMTAKGLAEAGHNVLVLEAGGDANDALGPTEWMKNFFMADAKTTNAPYPPLPGTDGMPRPDTLNVPSSRVLNIGKPERQYLEQMGPQPFMSSYERLMGGTTWHWLGVAYRLLPNDFKLHSTYQQGRDWPLGSRYEELLPWYQAAEQDLKVAWSVDDLEPLGYPPPKAGYKFLQPSIAQSVLDQELSRLSEGLEFSGKPVEIFSLPQARNSKLGRLCQGNTNCIPICPIGAKWNATYTIKAAQQMGAVFRSRTVVSKLHIDPDSKAIVSADFITYDSPTGPPTGRGTVRARIFILAANAIENVRLLRLSATAADDGFPNGLANSSDQLGRNLMDHPLLLSWAKAKDPVFSLRGPRVSSGIESLRDGEFRERRGGFRVDIGNEGWSWAMNEPYTTTNKLVSKGKFGRALREELNAEVIRQFRLGFLVEQLPLPENQVTLSDNVDKVDHLGLRVPSVRYHLGDYCIRGLQAAVRCAQAVFKHMGAEDCTGYLDDPPVCPLPEKPPKFDNDKPPKFTEGFGYFPMEVDGKEKYLPFYGSGHIVGTHRMGTKCEDAVTDTDLRSFDHRNLFILGTGAFPTIGTANPTLTLAALTLRTLDVLKKELG